MEVELLEGEYGHYVLPLCEEMLECCTEVVKEKDWSVVTVDRRKGDITILCSPSGLFGFLTGGHLETAVVDDAGLVGFSVQSQEEMSKVTSLLAKNHIALSANLTVNNHTICGWVTQYHESNMIKVLTKAGYKVFRPHAMGSEEGKGGSDRRSTVTTTNDKRLTGSSTNIC